MEKQIYLILIYILCYSCATVGSGQFKPVPNEQLVDIQVFPQHKPNADAVQVYGCVKEYKTPDPVLFGSVAIYKNDILVQGLETNFKGEFVFELSDLDTTASYRIEFGYLGFYPLIMDEFSFEKGMTYELNCSLAAKEPMLNGCCYCPSYEVPLIQQDNTTSGQVITSEQISHRLRGGG